LIVDFPLKMVIFYSYVKLPEGNLVIEGISPQVFKMIFVYIYVYVGYEPLANWMKLKSTSKRV